MAITTAVVPVAGLATRLRPLSCGVPKGLLPVAGQPVIQRVVDELAACGIERVVLVTGRGRAAFAAHFAESDGPEMVCVPQPEPLGLGDAILRAAPVLDGPFVIALGDALLGRGAPARVVLRLAAAVDAGADAAVAVEEVDAEATRHYGIVVPAGDGEDPLPDRRGRREARSRVRTQPAGDRRSLCGHLRAARRAARHPQRLRRRDPALRRAERAGRRRRPRVSRPARSAWTSARCPATARPSSSTRSATPSSDRRCGPAPRRCSMATGSAFARAALAGDPSDGHGGAVLAVCVPGLAAHAEAQPAARTASDPPSALVDAAVARYGRGPCTCAGPPPFRARSAWVDRARSSRRSCAPCARCTATSCPR